MSRSRKHASPRPTLGGRKHARSRFGRVGGLRLLVVLTSFVVLISGSAFGFEAASASRILPGVTISGVDVGEMTRAEAIAALRDEADSLLDRELLVHADDQTWQVTPAELGTTVDLEGTVDRALAMARAYAWPVRAFRRLFDHPVERSLELNVLVDERRAEQFIETVSADVNVSARSAGFSLDGDNERLVISTARDGVKLRLNRALGALMRALSRPERTSVDFALKRTVADVTAGDLGYTIAVRISENQLYLYEGLDLAKVYPVATGLGGFPTPKGEWEIVSMVENPTWVNPAPDGWGKDLPASIPPGPGNPLGTHAMYLNASGIRIHGTYDSDSIGTFASHGCIRMYISDSEELFGIVDVGTPVLIYS
ncbi:MAG: L,D-transpeptidase family protein [Actinomycetota bacterium]